jgi:hypothetical protein
MALDAIEIRRLGSRDGPGASRFSRTSGVSDLTRRHQRGASAVGTTRAAADLTAASRESQPLSTRRGRGTSSPWQFGQTSPIAVARWGQNVHS